MIRARLSIATCLLVLSVGQTARAQAISVTNVEELYSAVNNPANTGATLMLSPGTYSLSANDPNGAARPKGGRLEFQSDMAIVGVEGDRTAVIISGASLPASSFPQDANGPNAALRLGLGHNSLEWLTVRDSRSAPANIDAGLQPLDPGVAFIRIAHVASSGSSRGLNLINFGPRASGQTIEADIVDCEFFDNTFNLSEGLRVGNFQGAVGSTINARMTGNVSRAQKVGMLVVNNRATSSTITVTSRGNRFYDNALGTAIFGALSSNNTRADGNTIVFEGHGDQFLANQRASELDHGGIVVLGTENNSAAGGGSNNTVQVSLWGCRTGGNDGSDLLVIGARSLSAATAPHSQNDHVTVEIHGDGKAKGAWQPVVAVADTVPTTSGNGNSAVVIRY